MKIRAAVARAGNPHPRFEDVELSGPRADEVLVRMVATGVCHTDLKAVSVFAFVPRPVVLGHEGAGIVERVGAAVTKVAPGDPVVLSFSYCGHCPSCREGQPAYCHEQFALNFFCNRPDHSHHLSGGGGPIHGDFFGQSSFATFAIVTERNVVKVRKDAPLELLGPLGCGIQTGAGAILNDFQVRSGLSVAVFGVGSVGLSAVMAARIAGASRIIAVDRHAHRLEFAREFGAHDTLLAGGESVAAEIMRLTGEGVNFALDTTGAAQVMRDAIDVLAPRGTCGFVTGPQGDLLGVPVRNLLLGRTIRGIIEGNSNPDLFIPMLVDLFMAGRLPFDRFVRFYDHEKIADAFADVESGKTIKPILRFA
jgi:aryl-alcohol dehydrogenase